MRKVVLLNLDDAFCLQNLFNEELNKLNTVFISFDSDTQKLINECRLFASKKKILLLFDLLINRIKSYNFNTSLVTFYGSGDFHHVTLALLELAASRINKQFTVIHLDNHPDCVMDPVISCGSWINTALLKNYVNRIISIGICSNDLYLPELKRTNLNALQNEKLIILPFNVKPTFVFKKYHDCSSFSYSNHKIVWNNISKLSECQLTYIINDYINTDDIYITIDKDVINSDEQITNWDQGKFSLSTITELLQFLAVKKNIIGIDVLGDYSSIVYEGSFISRMYKKFETFKDQPKIYLNKNNIAKINESVNLKLLKTIIASCI